MADFRKQRFLPSDTSKESASSASMESLPSPTKTATTHADATPTTPIPKEAMKDEPNLISANSKKINQGDASGSKGTGVFIPESTAGHKQKSGESSKNEMSMEKQVRKDNKSYIQVSPDVFLPMEWPYEEYS